MRTKTIRAVIKKKIGEWLASIEDAALVELIEKEIVVTGGAIASMLLGEEVNDYDVYFKTKECAHEVAKYYIARFKPRSHNGIDCEISVIAEESRVKIVIQSAGIASADGTQKPYEYFEARPQGEAGEYVSAVMTDPGDIQDAHDDLRGKEMNAVDADPYRPVFMSTNAITLSGKIQIVLRFFGEPTAIHENYDFVHCTNYWTSAENEVVLNPKALESLLSKELRYVGSRYPVCSVIRLRKFIKRGWVINAGQILKMIMQINDLDLKDVAVLQDQLTGVDAAYFCEVIGKLKDNDPEKVNTAYLIEIIDRMF